MRALLLIALLGACGKKTADESKKKEGPPPVKVALVTAAEAPTPKQIVLTGMIVANQRTEVTADGAGKVLAVKVERGDEVKFGDPLLQLDVQSAALGAREVQANLASARAQRELAESECKRTQELFDKGAITRSEYDRQRTSCTSALQQVSALEARAAMMMKSVADGIVRAPFKGVISQRMVSAGEWVAPGRPLFVLVEKEPLKIELSVPEIAIGKIEPKQRVELRAVADPEHPAHATITRIGAEIGRTRSLIVEAELDKGSTLLPGMFAEAYVKIGDVERVVLPKDAITRRCSNTAAVGSGSGSGSAAPPPKKKDAVECRGKPRAFVLGKSGELEERLVQLGPVVEDKIAIVDGVNPGEKVVAKVTDTIIDGLRVTE
jgi:membrane fusion protein, multidrug efflux system